MDVSELSMTVSWEMLLAIIGFLGWAAQFIWNARGKISARDKKLSDLDSALAVHVEQQSKDFDRFATNQSETTQAIKDLSASMSNTNKRIFERLDQNGKDIAFVRGQITGKVKT